MASMVITPVSVCNVTLINVFLAFTVCNNYLAISHLETHVE